MKKTLSLFILSSIAITAFSQDTLQWKIVAKKTGDSTYLLTATTTLANGLHLYHNNKTVEGFEDAKFVFKQDNVEAVNNIGFNKNIEVIKDVLNDNKAMNVFTGSISITQNIRLKKFIPAAIKVSLSTTVATDSSLTPPFDNFIDVPLEGGKATNTTVKIINADLKNSLTQCGDKIEKGNLITIFLLGFIGGLIALLTPCMFPMIPVTVSFFTKRSPTRKKTIQNGLLYGFFIFVIYALASVPFHLLNLNSEIFNQISTSPSLNIIFFIVFIIFSISFFGYFEITLPHTIAGKADSKSNLGSTIGIFFMAVTLVIVSFSCTGVILGSLLVGTSSGGAWALTVGMSAFGIALGLPFALFAIFPNWLERLPKSGSWLDTVKKVLAFVEVALALKFLSNADLVMHWGILKRETFIAVWMVVSIGLALYAFGVLRLPHDYKGQKISWGRKLIGIIAIAFTLYLAPGLTKTKYANLKLLSGILPPLSYSIYGNDADRFKGLEPNVINDYNKAIALAKQQHKPLLIDFTGWACANCRRMEEEIWTQPEVAKMISENFILVSLYVDDKAKLPAEQQITNYKTKDGNVKDIITIGDLYATMESENFEQASQPLYIMLNNNEQMLALPSGSTLGNPTKYLQWLQCGLNAFK